MGAGQTKKPVPLPGGWVGSGSPDSAVGTVICKGQYYTSPELIDYGNGPVEGLTMSSSNYNLLLFFLFIVLVSVMGYMVLKLQKLESLTSPILKPVTQ